ncbi:MAG: ABC transporter [Citromicrobium sp.]|nr:MAG: ABC transporter [Citromicrobium sp.]
MSPAITLDNVVVMRGRTRAVDAVSLAISRGNWFGIVGANGSGKTSLLRAMAGRLGFAEGRCQVDGAEMPVRSMRAGKIGFAPPGESLPASLEVGQVLAIAAQDAVPELGELGEVLEIEALRHRRVGACSAGMRQRVAIAVAFARPCDIVVLDEPFNWLDPVVAYDLKRVLRNRVHSGMTIVTALHDVATLSTQCDEAVVMRDGCVALALSGSDLAEAASAPASFEERMVGLLRG